ncbi:MAG: glycosyltransferase [Planctomycetes bacterium]|nr:glycosyltransferase [Planctomycetota bacterium]
MKDGKIIIARLWPRYNGGIESRTPVILGINPQKYKTICVYLNRNSNEQNFFEQKGIKTFYVSQKRKFSVFNILAIWKLSKLLKREKVDILHCHKHKPTIYGTIAAKFAGVPVIISHVHGLNRSRNFKRKFMNRFIFKRVSKIVTVGQAVKKDVLRDNPSVCADKVFSLGNSIDYGRFADVKISKEQAKKNIGLPEKSFVFGTVGRLVPTKGQTFLLDAFAIVKQKMSQAELVFIGKGRLESQLKEKADKMGLADSVHFLASRSDIPQVLKAMDVFVLPSIAEGLPRSLLEAMAAGLPCVATAVGGIVEILGDGEFGLLVLAKSDQALAKAMMQFIVMPESEKNNIIEKAKQHIRDCYTHKVVIEKLQNVYEDAYAKTN